jgi:Ubiquitin family
MKASRNSYTVGVKLLSGKSFSVMVGPSDTVAALKQRIFEREGLFFVLSRFVLFMS